MKKAVDQHAVWLCEWDDAWVDFDEPEGSLKDSMPVITVGFIVRKTDSIITIAAERFPEGGYRCLTSIPMPLVRRLRQL